MWKRIGVGEELLKKYIILYYYGKGVHKFRYKVKNAEQGEDCYARLRYKVKNVEQGEDCYSRTRLLLKIAIEG